MSRWERAEHGSGHGGAGPGPDGPDVLDGPCGSGGGRYSVHPATDLSEEVWLWEIRDAQRGGTVVASYLGRQIAEAACLIANELPTSCRLCGRPGSGMVEHTVVCMSCLPQDATWMQVPVAGLRRWAQSHLR